MFTAIQLQYRGVNVTLIERNSNYDRIDLPKSYIIGVNWRGCRALCSVPGLYDHTTSHAIFHDDINVRIKNRNGNVKKFSAPRGSPENLKNALMLRFDMIRNMYDFAKQYQGIKFMLGCSLTNARFLENGKTELILSTEAGEQSTVLADLVLACDGRNSSIGKAIDEAAEKGSGYFETPNGVGSSEVDSPSTDLRIESILLSKDVLRDEFEKDEHGVLLNNITVFA